MGQQTMQGYLFLMNMMFRPILMVIGFLLMVEIIHIGGGFFLYYFPQAVAAIQANSITGLISIIGYIMVFVSGCMAIVNIGANMIHMVPNQVLSWAGGTMINNFGQGLQDHVGRTNSMTSGGAAAADVIRTEGRERTQLGREMARLKGGSGEGKKPGDKA